jgi:formin 2/WAS/WASL-interacting protein
MGFMDKAKKMAEQAQAKLDEAQKQFNPSRDGETSSGPAVEYDAHGRPIAQESPATAAPPHGDPLEGEAPQPPTAVPPTPGVPPTGQGDPVMPPPSAPPVAQPGVPPAEPAADAPAEDRNHPSYAPPKLSGGDPLAG